MQRTRASHFSLPPRGTARVGAASTHACCPHPRLPPTLSGATRLVPILAHPVDHVRAPRIYNPAFAAAGLDWCQVPMGVHPDDFAATVAQLARVGNLQGLNLTIPHKAAAHALCARLGPEARRTGVVNTMRIDADGQWSGESFDGVGFVEAARAHGMLWPERPVVLVGAGGAGTAIAFALAGRACAACTSSTASPSARST
jgi:shikimate dehydrogenase